MKVSGAEALHVHAERSDVVGMEQHGNDLVIRFKDGIVTGLDGYFLCSANDQPDLSFISSAAQQSYDVSFENGVCGPPAGTAQTLAYNLAPSSAPYVGGISSVAGGAGLAPLLGLGALGIGAAALAGEGGGRGGTTTPVVQTPPAAPVLQPTNGLQIKGTAEAGSSVGIDLDGNGTSNASVSVDSGGNWTYTPVTPVPDGATVIVKATDPAGNTSPPASVIVDGTTPTPTITSVRDDVSPVIGAVANGGRTDDRRPMIVGTGAEPNAAVAIFDRAAQIGTTRADAAGNWSFIPADALSEGDHNI